MKLILPILPEISLEGQRRCIYVHDNGVRCDKYTASGMCKEHMSNVTTFSKHFKSQQLRDQFISFVNDPRKMQLGNELAMLRVMIVQMIQRNKSEVMSTESIVCITQLCEKVMTMATAMSKLNQLTPEVVDNILNNAINVLAKYLPPDKLVEAAKEIQALSLVDPAVDTPIDPGNTINIGNENVLITTNDDPDSILKRTLTEEAIRLKVEMNRLQEQLDAESN